MVQIKGGKLTMSKKTYIIGAAILAAGLSVGFATGFYQGRNYQKTLDVKVMEEFKIARPVREEPRTGSRVRDAIVSFGQDVDEAAFHYSCAAYSNETLEKAQKKITGEQ
jgi:hypothetical protein